MFGRDAELRRIAEMAEHARAGRGGALCVVGPAGIGKTTLLTEVTRRWNGESSTARCVQTTTEFPYGALSQLLDPHIDRIGELPARQAAALRGALALAPAHLADPFAVAAATAGVVRASCRDAPLLLVVDDAQWLDPASADCLAHVVRRLERLAVLTVIACRAGESVTEWLLDLPTIRLERLDERSCSMMVRDRAPDATSDVVAAVVAASAGNPLAVGEFLAGLDDDQRVGRAPIPAHVRPVGRLAELYERRLVDVSVEGHIALVICAAVPTDSLTTIGAALDAAGVQRSVLVDLDARGIVRIGDRTVTFPHPLARSAALHVATAEQRRAAHLALAAVVDPRERGWHLAAAAVGPDEEAASALVAAALEAADRCAYATASRAMEAAAGLTADPTRAIAHRVAAANMAITANRPAGEVLRILDDALAAGPNESVHSAAQYLRGIALHRASLELRATERMLVLEAGRCLDRDLAAAMFSLAAYCALVAGDMVSTHDHAVRARQSLTDQASPERRAPVLATLAAGCTYRGRPGDALVPLLELQTLTPDVPPGALALAVPLAMQTMVGLGLLAEARAICEHHIADSRDSGALAALPFLLTTVADAAYRMGDWTTTETCCDEAIPLARETDQNSVVLMASCVMARLSAATGRDEQAHHLVDEVLATARPAGLGSMVCYAAATRLFLAVSRGVSTETMASLIADVRTAIDATRMVEETMVPWRADAIELAIAHGDLASARADLEVLADHAQVTGSHLTLAWWQRCRGLLDDDVDDAFAAALEHHDAVDAPFERARTLLAYGSRLHRSSRRVEARDRLQSALEIFDRLGAEPWRERAEAELRAAGGRPTRGARVETDALTDRERRVALAVATGLTNREVAAAQFISVKTVEFHLARVYRKLGVRTRTQLAALIRDRVAE